MKFYAKLLKYAYDIKIRKMKPTEVEETLEVAYLAFSKTLGVSREELKTEIRASLDRGSNCYVAVSDGKIIGGYFLSKRKKTFKELQELHLESLADKKGIMGIALFLLPEYRGTGAGRKLRDIPEKLGADFVWGMHYKALNNVQNWVNHGRVVIGETDDYVVTLKEFPENQERNKAKIKDKKQGPVEKSEEQK